MYKVPPQRRCYVGYAVLTPAVMSSNFWDTMSCSLVKATDISVEYVVSIFKAEEYESKKLA
jgi:hypothetical protein